MSKRLAAAVSGVVAVVVLASAASVSHTGLFAAPEGGPRAYGEWRAFGEVGVENGRLSVLGSENDAGLLDHVP